jgi:hypothetical protein
VELVVVARHIGDPELSVVGQRLPDRDPVEVERQ